MHTSLGIFARDIVVPVIAIPNFQIPGCFIRFLLANIALGFSR